MILPRNPCFSIQKSCVTMTSGGLRQYGTEILMKVCTIVVTFIFVLCRAGSIITIIMAQLQRKGTYTKCIPFSEKPNPLCEEQITLVDYTKLNCFSFC